MKRVYIEMTPNPSIMKFVCDKPLTLGSLEFDIHKSSEESKLADELLQFPFVTKVYITANFVAVQKNDVVDWEMVADSLKEIVNKHLENGTIVFQPEEKEDYSEMYVELSPNPQVMKFIAPKKLFNGVIEAKSVDLSNGIPLAKELFSHFDFVKEVFISDNYVSITKSEESDWTNIAMNLRDFLMNYLQEGKEIVSENYSVGAQGIAEIPKDKVWSELEEEIKRILVEYVQPAVATDGGNIELIDFAEDTKIATMLLQGACSGCPSSTMTLKNGIETMLKEMLPGKIESVVAING